MMILFALMINVLVLVCALPMDLGRAYMASAAVQGAADAAAVASAVAGGDEQEAKDYFLSNLPVGTLGIGFDYDTDVTHTVDTKNNTVSVDTSGFDVPTIFSNGINAKSAVDVAGGVTVGLATSTFKPADYYFIIDSSGSMRNGSGSGTSKSQAVGIAIGNFLKIVFKNQGFDANGIESYRVSLANYRTGPGKNYPQDPDNNVGSATDLLVEQNEIIAALAPMLGPDGATCGGCGLRRSKDKFFEEIAINTNSEDRLRVFIFMTDGMLNRWNDVDPNKPRDTSFPSDYVGVKGDAPHAFAARECFEIKDIVGATTAMDGDKIIKNTTVWTVRFGSGANSGLNRDVMDYCASDPTQSVYAATGNDLDDIFSKIGRETGRVLIKR